MARSGYPGNAKWQALRQQVIARAKGTCERCRERPGDHVHHIIYGGVKRGEEKLEWLQYVCLVCHQQIHPHHTFNSPYMQKLIAEHRKQQKAKRRTRK